MSHIPSIQFPIFLLDRDEYMYRFNDPQSVYSLEEIDVVEGEYVGRWDVTGKPLEIYWAKGGAILEPTDKDQEREVLMNSIIKYARLRVGKFVLPPQEISNDPAKLFQWADSQ